MGPVLLDSSFLIDLERELTAGVAGPAMAWLRAQRGQADRALVVSPISIAEFLEGFADERKGLVFVERFPAQTVGQRQARCCAEVQRRARRRGRRFGENDAWQIACAKTAGARIVGRDRTAFMDLGRDYETYG